MSWEWREEGDVAEWKGGCRGMCSVFKLTGINFETFQLILIPFESIEYVSVICIRLEESLRNLSYSRPIKLASFTSYPGQPLPPLAVCVCLPSSFH